MDIKIIETENGGDFIKKPRDLVVVNSFENMVYLGLFGGNLEASTTPDKIDNQENFDYWGNALLWPDDSGLQFNSETERTLKQVSLTSQGRVIIEQAVKKDLEFMSPFAEVSVDVTIDSVDKVKINVILAKPSNLQQKEFIYIWDKFVGDNYIVTVTVDTFDQTFDFSFS